MGYGLGGKGQGQGSCSACCSAQHSPQEEGPASLKHGTICCVSGRAGKMDEQVKMVVIPMKSNSLMSQDSCLNVLHAHRAVL